MHKKHIHDMLERLVTLADAEFSSKGKDVNTQEMGAVVDMIKDLCDAEMLCYKKCYYEKIVEAMEEEEEKDELMLKMMIEEHGEAEGRAGYDRWRNSKGRFDRKGHGHETSMRVATGHGYTPNPLYYDDPRFWDKPWMATVGYDRNDPRYNSGRTDNSDHEQSHAAARMGYTPDAIDDGRYNDTRSQYHDARRHYQETGSQEHKMKMDEKADEYLRESFDTMLDIFTLADPKMQQKMKDDIAKLFREMGGK